MCYFGDFVGSVQPGPRMGLIQEETDGRGLWIRPPLTLNPSPR